MAMRNYHWFWFARGTGSYRDCCPASLPSSPMRFLPTRIHAFVDYIWGILLILAPYLFGFADHSGATWTAWAFGAGAILYSLVTDYESGLVRLIPMPAHLALDCFAGATLAASPWLFGFAERVRWPHLGFGLFSVVASLVTLTRAEPPRGRPIGKP